MQKLTLDKSLKTIKTYKSILTLFAHEKSSTLIETFPRSGSTVILSNLALSNLSLHTEYKKNNVNLIRNKLKPQRDISQYVDKVLLVRSPITRIESFFLTKLVAGEPKSIVAIGKLLFKCLRSYPTPLFKKLKGFFSYEVTSTLGDYEITNNLDQATCNALFELKFIIQKLTFQDMLNIFSQYGLPSDSHVYPQFHMKTLRLSQYSSMFNLNNFESFIQWYNLKTGESFNTSFNKTQPNNRLDLKKFEADPEMTVLNLQHFLSEKMTPVSQSIFGRESMQQIKTMFPEDYDLHILTSAN